MSIEAVGWAFQVRGIKSSEKLVLTALANYASKNGEAWPSVKQLSDCTSLDRKTVLKSIGILVECGFIECTGSRKGETGRIKMYRLNMHITVPNFPTNSPQNGTVKQSQISTQTVPNLGQNQNLETVPNFPTNSPKFPHKWSQISAETVPNLGHGTVIEPLKNRNRTVIGRAREPEPPEKPAKRKTRLPDNWSLPKDWLDWALGQGLSVPEVMTESECFADHWHSKGETRSDWLATWRNWVRRSKTFFRSKVPRQETIAERNARIEREIFGRESEPYTIEMEA